MPYVEYDEVGASCSECGRNFRSPEDLETHRTQVHHPDPGTETVPKPSTTVCAMCGGSFGSVAALRQHNERAHR